jgi:hypothetical protein
MAPVRDQDLPLANTCFAPPAGKGKGRPRTKRLRRKSKKKTYRCSFCGSSKHNKRRCDNEGQGNSDSEAADGGQRRQAAEDEWEDIEEGTEEAAEDSEKGTEETAEDSEKGTEEAAEETDNTLDIIRLATPQKKSKEGPNPFSLAFRMSPRITRDPASILIGSSQGSESDLQSSETEEEARRRIEREDAEFERQEAEAAAEAEAEAERKRHLLINGGSDSDQEERSALYYRRKASKTGGISRITGFNWEADTHLEADVYVRCILAEDPDLHFFQECGGGVFNSAAKGQTNLRQQDPILWAKEALDKKRIMAAEEGVQQLLPMAVREALDSTGLSPQEVLRKIAEAASESSPRMPLPLKTRVGRTIRQSAKAKLAADASQGREQGGAKRRSRGHSFAAEAATEPRKKRKKQ